MQQNPMRKPLAAVSPRIPRRRRIYRRKSAYRVIRQRECLLAQRPPLRLPARPQPANQERPSYSQRR